MLARPRTNRSLEAALRCKPSRLFNREPNEIGFVEKLRLVPDAPMILRVLRERVEAFGDPGKSVLVGHVFPSRKDLVQSVHVGLDADDDNLVVRVCPTGPSLRRVAERSHVGGGYGFASHHWHHHWSPTRIRNFGCQQYEISLEGSRK
jgi:hypothetical protein